MKYQIELKVHGQKFDLNISDADFALYLNCTLLRLNDNDIEAAINRADKALYNAKKSGRNKVCTN